MRKSRIGDINNREDVAMLVRSFYEKVRKHERLGPIFNTSIQNWEDHFVKLTDFWETNLFWKRSYEGNPMRAHLQVDQAQAEPIEQALFGHWLELWFGTLDELFSGQRADMAKEQARNMAHILFMRMYEARKGQKGRGRFFNS